MLGFCSFEYSLFLLRYNPWLVRLVMLISTIPGHAMIVILISTFPGHVMMAVFIIIHVSWPCCDGSIHNYPRFLAMLWWLVSYPRSLAMRWWWILYPCCMAMQWWQFLAESKIYPYPCTPLLTQDTPIPLAESKYPYTPCWLKIPL